MVRRERRRADGAQAPVSKRRRLLTELSAAVGVSMSDDSNDVERMLASLAAPGLARHEDHERAAALMLPQLIAMVRRWREELPALLEKPMPRGGRSYASVRYAAEKLYPSAPVSWRDLVTARPVPARGRRRVDEQRIKTTGTYLDALLRDLDEQLELAIALSERLARLATAADGEHHRANAAKSGPAADDGLTATAKAVRGFLVSIGRRSARQETVELLERHGWHLGPGTRRAKAERLRKREGRTRS